MTALLNSRRIHVTLAIGICSLLMNGPARSQDAQPEKARALLDQVKKSEQDRQIAVKQKEIQRIKEDEEKAERDSKDLEQTIASTTGLITDRSEYLSTLAMQSRKLEHDLAVAEARINAERIKIEGLRALAMAQGKSLSALARHSEEAKARSRVEAIELEMLEGGKVVPGEGREDTAETGLAKARRALSMAEGKTAAEERLAHDAMKAATAKMTMAEARAAAAQRLADTDPAEPKPKAPEPVAEKKATEPAAPRAVSVETQKPRPVAEGPKAGSTPSKPAAAPATSKSPTSPPRPLGR